MKTLHATVDLATLDFTFSPFDLACTTSARRHKSPQDNKSPDSKWVLKVWIVGPGKG
jgi:hypothetical protein